MEKYALLTATIAIVVLSGGFFISKYNPNQFEKTEEIHSHALFYVVVNGTEKDFTDRSFQLQAKRVHLEGNKSRIVHKHASDVTWYDFLNTLNVSIDNGEKLCIKVRDNRTCGSGEVYSTTALESEIKQGDKLVIAIGESYQEVIDNYRKHQLPRSYKPASTRGRRA